MIIALDIFTRKVLGQYLGQSTKHHTLALILTRGGQYKTVPYGSVILEKF